MSDLGRRVSAFVVAILLVLASLPCAAQQQSKAEAQKHYKRGLELVDEEALEEALLEFQQAYKVHPHFTVLFNIGRTYVGLGRPVEAVDALEQFLRDGGNQIEADDKNNAEAELQRQRARIAQIVITVKPDGASVTIDGKDVGKSPLQAAVRVGIGSHTITATLAGHREVRSVIGVVGEQRATVELVLEREGGGETKESPPNQPPPTAPVAAPPSPGPARPAPPVASSGGSSTIVPWVLVGAGAVAGAGAFLHWKWNDGRHEDWEADDVALREPGAASQPGYATRVADHNDELASIKSADTVTAVLAIGSAALVGTGTVLLLTREERATTVSAAPLPGGAVAWIGGVF